MSRRGGGRADVATLLLATSPDRMSLLLLERRRFSSAWLSPGRSLIVQLCVGPMIVIAGTSGGEQMLANRRDQRVSSRKWPITVVSMGIGNPLAEHGPQRAAAGFAEFEDEVAAGFRRRPGEDYMERFRDMDWRREPDYHGPAIGDHTRAHSGLRSVDIVEFLARQLCGSRP